MNADERDALLTTIVKARTWIEDLVAGRVDSFAAIAKQEGKVERHIRLLAPLAFLSPKVILNIVDGIAPSIAVKDLAKQTPYCWNH
jgi:site-specific DNA recombinase